MAKNIDCIGAVFLPCAFIMGFAAACLLVLCLLPSAASAREIAEVDSPEWCARHANTVKYQGKEHNQVQAESQRLEAACRAALPDLAPAASCPDRQLDRCVAQQRDGGSWCAILCCFDPDAPSCRAAAASIPAFLATPKR